MNVALTFYFYKTEFRITSYLFYIDTHGNHRITQYFNMGNRYPLNMHNSSSENSIYLNFENQKVNISVSWLVDVYEFSTSARYIPLWSSHSPLSFYYIQKEILEKIEIAGRKQCIKKSIEPCLKEVENAATGIFGIKGDLSSPLWEKVISDYNQSKWRAFSHSFITAFKLSTLPLIAALCFFYIMVRVCKYIRHGN